MSKKSKTTKKAAKPKKKSVDSKKKSAAKPKTKRTSKTKKAPPNKAAPKKSVKKKPSRETSRKRNQDILRELETEIKSEDEQVCLGAVERLGVLNHPDATRVLIVALADSRYMVRIHAAAQLGERKDKKSVDALVESLNDESMFVRQTVAGALENIGGAKAKKAVSRAEKDGLLLDELPEGKRLGE